MTQPNPSTACARAIVDELARGGVRLAIVSPGSRSAALAIAAAGHPDVETRVVLDERSAGFHALGHTKAGGGPAAVICTSGTAVANFFPAVVEADMSLTPLIVLSADRPAAMRDTGANQTIDQREMFGRHSRLYAEIPVPHPGLDLNDSWRTVVAGALATAMGSHGRPGPVQVNVAFEEPTVPVSDDGRTRAEPYPFDIDGRQGGSTWVSSHPEPVGPADLELPAGGRGVVVAGDGEYDRERLVAAATALGWPVLATAASGMRGMDVVGSYHHILARAPAALTPDVAYVIGGVGPSRRLEAYLATIPTQVRIDLRGRHIDPTGTATVVLGGDPVATLEAQEGVEGPPGWRETWLDTSKTVEAALRTVLAEAPISGPVAVDALNGLGWETLVAASSLPIRDVDAHLSRAGMVIANRGASGIDGLISTAMGAAGRRSGMTVALTGDLSLLHDSNGFLVDQQPDLVVVVVDNGGGGLFDALPPARHAPDFERLFITPHGRDLSHLADLHELGYFVASDRESLEEALSQAAEMPGTHLIRAVVSRPVEIELRAALDDVSRSALRR